MNLARLHGSFLANRLLWRLICYGFSSIFYCKGRRFILISVSYFLRAIKMLHRLLCGDSGAWRYLFFIAVNTPVLLCFKLQSERYQHKGLISIVTPTFGNLDALDEAIASLSRQTSDRWHQVIIADGLFNGFWVLLFRLWRSKQASLLLSWPTRCYGNHQRNVGMLAARGEYLLFLDDDNVLYSHAIQTIAQLLDQNPEANWILVPIDYDSHRHNIHTVLAPALPLLLGQVDSLNLVVKRQLALKVGGWINDYTADFAFLNRVTQDSSGFVASIQPIGHHR